MIMKEDSKETIKPLIPQLVETEALGVIVNGLAAFKVTEEKLNAESSSLGECVFGLRQIAEQLQEPDVKYVVKGAKNWRDGNYTRFEALLASKEIARATAFRHLRAYERTRAQNANVSNEIKSYARKYEDLFGLKLGTLDEIKNADGDAVCRPLAEAYIAHIDENNGEVKDLASIITAAHEIAKAALEVEGGSDLSLADKMVDAMIGVLRSTYRKCKSEHKGDIKAIHAAYLALARPAWEEIFPPSTEPEGGLSQIADSYLVSLGSGERKTSASLLRVEVFSSSIRREAV